MSLLVLLAIYVALLDELDDVCVLLLLLGIPLDARWPLAHQYRRLRIGYHDLLPGRRKLLD